MWGIQHSWQAPTAHRSLKPPTLSALGDMALATGKSFILYLPAVFQVLQQAAQLQVDRDNFDAIDYCNELRDGCLEAYTGIIQGLKSADNQLPGERAGWVVRLLDDRSTGELSELFQGSVVVMMVLIVNISKDEDKSETNISNALGLLG